MGSGALWVSQTVLTQFCQNLESRPHLTFEQYFDRKKESRININNICRQQYCDSVTQSNCTNFRFYSRSRPRKHHCSWHSAYPAESLIISTMWQLETACWWYRHIHSLSCINRYVIVSNQKLAVVWQRRYF